MDAAGSGFLSQDPRPCGEEPPLPRRINPRSLVELGLTKARSGSTMNTDNRIQARSSGQGEIPDRR